MNEVHLPGPTLASLDEISEVPPISAMRNIFMVKNPGTIVFQRLGVQVEQVLMDNPTALEKLKSGELAALVRVIGKPLPVLRAGSREFGSSLSAHSPTTTRSVNSPVRNIRRLFHKGRRPTLSRCRLCSQFSTRRKIPTATGVCKGLPRLFSPSGTTLANPTAIQNGATSILRRRFPAGPAGASRANVEATSPQGCGRASGQ